MTLSESELERYSRQLVLPEWSGKAQERLKSASAIVVGAGALGSPVATYLAAAGVGRLASSTRTWSSCPTCTGNRSTSPDVGRQKWRTRP